MLVQAGWSNLHSLFQVESLAGETRTNLEPDRTVLPMIQFSSIQFGLPCRISDLESWTLRKYILEIRKQAEGSMIQYSQTYSWLRAPYSTAEWRE
jgi:hypothetical protein